MAGELEAKKKADAEKAKREIPQAPSSMFFQAVSAPRSASV
jgi:U3 small nucleolar RNA-associated protein 24